MVGGRVQIEDAGIVCGLQCTAAVHGLRVDALVMSHQASEPQKLPAEKVQTVC